MLQSTQICSLNVWANVPINDLNLGQATPKCFFSPLYLFFLLFLLYFKLLLQYSLFLLDLIIVYFIFSQKFFIFPH